MNAEIALKVEAIKVAAAKFGAVFDDEKEQIVMRLQAYLGDPSNPAKELERLRGLAGAREQSRKGMT